MKSTIHIDNYAAFRYFNLIERYRIRRVIEAFAYLARYNKYYRVALQKFYMASTEKSFSMCRWMLRTYQLWKTGAVTGYSLEEMVEAVEHPEWQLRMEDCWKEISEQQKKSFNTI